MRVYVFDRVRDRNLRAMNRRVATCYRWAESHGIEILDEVIDWDPAVDRDSATPDTQRPLARAVARCERDGAGLLVHSTRVLKDLPEARGDLLRRAAHVLLVVVPCHR